MKIRFTSFSGVTLSVFALVLLVAGCKKYEQLENPPIAGGECEYTKRGFSSVNAAQLELNRLKDVFLSSTLGSKPVQVLRSNTFVSSTENGSPYSWGMQLVYTCDAAEIKTDSARNFENRTAAEAALVQRKATLEAGRYIKVLDWGVDDLSTTSCSTCCDSEGNNCGDCNCSTDYEYGYWVVYAQVNPNNPRQAAIIQAYLENKALLNALSGKNNPTITDTLSVARKVLPSGSAAGKLVTDWHRLFSKISPKNALPKRKACPAGAKEVPGSRHQVRE